MLQIVEDGELGEGQKVETAIAEDLERDIVQVHVSVGPWGCTKFESFALCLACLSMSMCVKHFLQVVEAKEDTFLVVFILATSVSSFCILAGVAALIQRKSMPTYLWYAPEFFFVLAVAVDRARTAIKSPQCDAAVMLSGKYIHVDYLVYIDIALLLALAWWDGKAPLDARVHQHIEQDLRRAGILAVDVAGLPRDHSRLYRWWLDNTFFLHLLLAYVLSVRCCESLGCLGIRFAEAECFNCRNVVRTESTFWKLLFAKRRGPCLTVDLAVWLSSLLVGLLSVKLYLWLIRPVWKHLGDYGQRLLERGVSGRFSDHHRSFSSLSQQLLEEDVDCIRAPGQKCGARPSLHS